MHSNVQTESTSQVISADVRSSPIGPPTCIICSPMLTISIQMHVPLKDEFLHADVLADYNNHFGEHL